MNDLAPRENKLFKRIDEVIHYLWDPIGVSSMPSARNEYLSYSSKVYQMVNQGDSKGEVIEYLTKVQTEQMSLPVSKEKIQRVVSIIFNWSYYLKDCEAGRGSRS